MAINFFPHEEDLTNGTLQERLDVLFEAAERYKTVVLDVPLAKSEEAAAAPKKIVLPRDIAIAFNWQGLSAIMREIRELPETSSPNKIKKADSLARLADVYEVLRGAKMAKLEAVRLALVNEANQLRASAAQVV